MNLAVSEALFFIKCYTLVHLHNHIDKVVETYLTTKDKRLFVIEMCLLIGKEQFMYIISVNASVISIDKNL